uniref:Uncharacterized protein n=1 Tax=Amphimedon queenslandica TaxID=400682 RepID=A0A1X7SQG6_AMPQE
MFQFIPKFTRSSRSCPWLSGPLQHQMNELLTLRRKSNTHTTPHLQAKLSASESAFSSAFQNAKANYEEELFKLHGSERGKIYRYIRSITKSTEFPQTLSFGSKSASDNHTKALLFNE